MLLLLACSGYILSNCKLVEFTVVNISLCCCLKAISPFQNLHTPRTDVWEWVCNRTKAIRLSRSQFTIQIGLFWNTFQGKILHTVALNIVNMHILLQTIRLTVHQGISMKKQLFCPESATLANGTSTVHSETVMSWSSVHQLTVFIHKG